MPKLISQIGSENPLMRAFQTTAQRDAEAHLVWTKRALFMLCLSFSLLARAGIMANPTRGLNWETEDKRLIWLTLQDGDRDWKTQLALPQDAIFNEANLERPTGGNTISAGQYPPFVFFDGESRYPDPGLRLPFSPGDHPVTNANWVIALPVESLQFPQAPAQWKLILLFVPMSNIQAMKHDPKSHGQRHFGLRPVFHLLQRMVQ